MPSSIEIRHLTKRYRRLTALDDVSLTIRHGEVLGLIGPNGAGKTTLFECLAGVQPRDGGELIHEGRVIGAREERAVMFYVPDGVAPWPRETVRWVLDFFVGSAARRADVVADLRLEELMPATIATLSKGQRKRVLLALGLLAPQPILLVDEPFEGLDLRQSRDLAVTLRAHAAACDRTLCLSIHQIADARRVCDRFVLLSGGRVCGEGTYEELRSQAAARGVPGPLADLEEVFLAL